MTRRVIWVRDALDDLRDVVRYIGTDHLPTGRRVAAAIRAAGDKLGEFATGHPGRVEKTYEKSVARLPYIIVYRLETHEVGEAVVVLRVINSARDWPDDTWPQ